ncbi:MAG: hypothetical protein RLN76_10205 [Phycisphaeraceae bacterium]
MFRPSVWIAVLVLIVSGFLMMTPGGADLSELRSGWNADPIWYDGLCEIATYKATRVIYGQPRDYTARVFTNKEQYSPKTTTKVSGASGIEVFKHHRRDGVPTENYTYYFSTMAYLDAGSLGPVKLEMASQEDCGATFKSLVVEGGRMRYLQSSYFPGEGIREGDERIDRGVTVFFDGLTLSLRSFPFGSGKVLTLEVVPPQIDTHLTQVTPVRATVRDTGKEVVSLPIGDIEAHHLVVELDRAIGGSKRFDYWFAAEGAYVEGEAGLHLLVKHAGPWGQTLELEGIERRAYWLR